MSDGAAPFSHLARLTGPVASGGTVASEGTHSDDGARFTSMRMAHHPSRDPRRETHGRGYRLPDVLVADRAPAGIVLALLGALVCSLGTYRACQLQREASEVDHVLRSLP